MKRKATQSSAIVKMHSLDNRIRLRSLEQQIAELERVIADLELEQDGNLTHRHTLEQALKESCQIYRSIELE